LHFGQIGQELDSRACAANRRFDPCALPPRESAKPRNAAGGGVRELGGLRVGTAEAAKIPVEKPKRERKPKVKNDPKHVAAARELRDRYLERFNGGLMLSQTGKYAVGRVLQSEDKGLRIEDSQGPSSTLQLPSSSPMRPEAA
jgi:hypothetical protein